MFLDAANAFDGRYGLTLRSVGGTVTRANQTWTGWRPATSYTLAFHGKTTGGVSGGHVYMLNETTGVVLASVPFGATGWTPYAVTFTSPTSATDVVRTFIGNENPNQGSTAHVDNIGVRATADAW